MKLEKAIEILDTHQCDMPRNQVPDLIDAIKLAIEALKRINRHRLMNLPGSKPLLPGETREEVTPCK